MFTFEIGVNKDFIDTYSLSMDDKISRKSVENVFFYEVLENVEIKDMPMIIEDYRERYEIAQATDFRFWNLHCKRNLTSMYPAVILDCGVFTYLRYVVCIIICSA